MSHGPAPRFIGRRVELGTLRWRLECALRGKASAVAIGGEPGIGRTALLDALAGTAARLGFRHASGRGHPGKREVGFGVVQQILDELTAPEARAAAPTPAQGPGALLPDPGAEPDDRTVSAVFASFDGLLADAGARAPLLVTVDDAHFGDPLSLRCLAHATRRVREVPFVLVITYDETEPEADASPLAELTATAHRVSLTGLGRDEVAEFVSRAVAPEPVDAETAQACHRVTDGHPLLLEELLGTLRQERPTGLTPQLVLDVGARNVAQWLRARLSRCPEAGAIARAIAVLGDDADFGRASALARLDLDDACARVDRLVRLKLVADGHPLRFTHSFFRGVILDGMAVGTRIAWHTRAAELLYESRAPGDAVAAHLLHGDVTRQRWATAVLRDAARREVARGAPHRAAPLLRRALDTRLGGVHRAVVLRELGSAELATDHAAGTARLRAALAAAPDADEAAHTTLLLASALVSAEANDEAAALADHAAGWLGDTDQGTAWQLRAVAYQAEQGRLGTAALARERERGLLADAPDDPRLLQTWSAYLAHRHSRQGHNREATVRCADLALADQQLSVADRPHHLALLALLYADAPALADPVLSRLGRAAERGGHLRSRALVPAFRGAFARSAGRLADAVAHLRTADGLLVSWSGGRRTHEGSWCAALLAEALVEQGRTGEAHELLAGRDLSARLPDLYHHNWVLYARGRLHLARGRHDEALADLLECGRRLEEWQVENPAVLPWRSQAALACLALGERDRARRLAGGELAAARRWGTPRAVGVALTALGRAESGPRATGVLDEAVTALRSSPARLELAHALYALGVACRGRGQLDEAREHLTAAGVLGQRCEALPLVTRTAEELAALGPTPSATASGGLLTRQQSRVADLASGGLANKDIAVRLGVSLRCVEFHLSGAYQKLGISGRRELHRALKGLAPRGRGSAG
ncbi:ATP-binding protein [Streptomyces spectabilis]|uniref:ATP-binding protein n=1 Tax=Streptomyces spectabilis TaxID=68270 RepID=UPI00137659D9|nr:LuxR family transcriptional regulator [Streptomyces spectabilis]